MGFDVLTVGSDSTRGFSLNADERHGTHDLSAKVFSIAGD